MAISIYSDKLVIPVLLYLYTPLTKDLPLNDKRISIKDNMHLTGVKTSIGNYIYLDYYGP